MALGVGYDRQGCCLARSLEVVGERWTLLIVRDCFFGVSRFGDFLAHLDISRAVLAERLNTLVDAGVLSREGQTPHRNDYRLTDAGVALWPSLFALSKWGARYARGDHPARVYAHAQCGTDIDDVGRCPACGQTPAPFDLVMRPGEGRDAIARTDRVTLALNVPHRLLTPI